MPASRCRSPSADESTFDETVDGLRTLPVAIPQNVTLVPEAGVVAGP